MLKSAHPAPIGVRAREPTQTFLHQLGFTAIDRSVLLLGIFLRVYLALVNAEANDDHLAVIKIVARQHRLPRLHEAWEGFQPKLYHVAVAILWNLNPWPYSVIEIRIAQLVACAAGIVTLLLIRRAVGRWELSPINRTITFAFAALNPTLIGINAQATNDSFVILFGTLALLAASAFLRTGQQSAFLLMSAATVLAALSKGNGLVVFFALTATLILAIIKGPLVPHLNKGRLFALTTGFVAAFLSLTYWLGSYRQNWHDTGNPFAINGEPAPTPHLLERTYVYRPGTISIVDTYLTFRLLDLLKQPYITNSPVDYPLHRTSLWSQLYARAHFTHFAQHPPSWKNTNDKLLNFGRMIFLFALLPTAYLAIGLWRGFRKLVLGALKSSSSAHRSLEHCLYALVGAGYLAFIIIYSMTYRDFATMKVEFLFPGLLGFMFFFARQIQRAYDSKARWPLFQRGGPWVLATLPLLYVADVVLLAVQLTHR